MYYLFPMNSDPSNERAANNKKYYIQMLAEQEVDTKGDEGDAAQVTIIKWNTETLGSPCTWHGENVETWI